MTPNIRFGLCCINTVLRKDDIFCSRTCNRKNFTVKKAKELALLNLEDIIKLVDWNDQHNIKCLRLSSDMFPHFTDDETESYDLDFAIPTLKRVGEHIRKLGHRVLFHPGQYNQVGTPSQDVFEKTVKDLKMHADILDYMGIDRSGVLIVHGGGTYGDKQKTISRWISQFKKLPLNVQNRLCIEHCERQYNVDDVLYISEKCRIPVVFDTHHYECYRKLHPEEKVSRPDHILNKIVKTWKDIVPIMHISEQGQGKIGHHSDYIDNIPQYLLDFVIRNNIKIDLEVEAKMKEQAILRLQLKYHTK